MKTKLYLFISVILIIGASQNAKSQIIFSEGFESGSIPLGWMQEYVIGTRNWAYQAGGNSGNPPTAHSGSFNALFFYGSYGNETTMLITPAINTTTLTQPLLTFWHAQKPFSGDIDQLKIYYRLNTGDSWHQIADYPNAVLTWTKREILLPGSSTTLQIAFEARTGYGYGVCVDDVTIEEAPSVQKFVNSITINQDPVTFAYQNSSNNPVLKITLDVDGYSGSLMLNQIVINSLNTSDADISSAGVKLFRTSNDGFSATNQLGAGTDFISGEALINGLNYDLPPGITYLWITYDVDANAIPYHVLDARVLAGDISIGLSTFPAVNESPAGNKLVLQPVFYDDFSSLTGWTLTGEFEIAPPQGLGGSYGDPDPATAYVGTNVLGTDLTGLGSFPYDYEPNLPDKAYQAVSPTIDCSFFTDVSLKFRSWLNIDFWDNATVEISNDNGATWNVIWDSPGLLEATAWFLQELDISDYADDLSQVKIRFTLGTSDGTWNYSGWNIDEFVVTGNFIENEAGVTAIVEPQSGCGHSASEMITVIVENFAGAPSNDTIPVCFTANGGLTMIRDTIFASLGVGEDTVYTFIPHVDLSVPGINLEMFAATVLPDDEFTENDTVYTQITLIPSHTVPYFENFESGTAFWFSSGTNNSWEHGTPAGSIINTAYSGNNAWVTNLNGNYNDNETSWVESPCFNFTGAENMSFEMKAWWATDVDFDGAAVMYSADGGSSWNVLGSFGDNVNWYNYEVVAGLTTGFGFDNGWNNESLGWITVSHILPAALNNNPEVKFRIVFGSDNSMNNFDGFAFDDIRIYELPPDVAVTAVDLPESDCELSDNEQISITIENTGADTIHAGETIDAGFTVNSGPEVSETITLTDDLHPGETFIYTFTAGMDFSAPGTYSVLAFVTLAGDINSTNDTVSGNVTVFGNPVFDLGPDIFTLFPDTVVLTGPSGAGFEYLWTGGSTEMEFNVPAAGTYYLTVNNTYGCTSIDSIHIYMYDADLRVESLVFPLSDCSFDENEPIRIKIKNNGTYVFPAGTPVDISYSVNGSAFINETLILGSDLPVSSNIQYTFVSTVDMTAFIDYNFTFAVYQSLDINPTNDSLDITVHAYGFPEIDLGVDTIFTTQPDTVVLNAGGGYENYLWQDASIDSVFYVNATGTYFVEVSDEFGCTGYDTVIVELIDFLKEGNIGDVLIFPNPADDYVIIEAHLSYYPASVEILNSIGQKIYSSTLVDNQSSVSSLNDLPTGLYQIIIKNKREVIIKKLIIK